MAARMARPMLGYRVAVACATAILVLLFLSSPVRHARAAFNLSAPPTCIPTYLTTLPVGDHPKAIASAPALHRAYVNLFDTSSVLAIDTTTDRPIAKWATDGQGNANGIAFAGDRAYVSKRNTAKVAVMDATAGSLIGAVPVGKLPYGVGAAGNRVWVANFDDSTVSVIDTLANRVIAKPAIGPNPALVAPLNDRAFVSFWGGGVAVVDANGTVLSRNTSLGGGTFGVAANTATNRVYASNRDSRTISMMDAASSAVLKSIQETSTPYALAVNPASNLLYIVLADAAHVRVRDGSTLGWVADLGIGAQGDDGGDGIAVVDNKVYISNNAAQSISVISDPCGTATPSATPTNMPTDTLTASPSPTVTAAPTRTRTVAPSASPTSTPTPSPTLAPASATSSPTNTPTLAVTPTRLSSACTLSTIGAVALNDHPKGMAEDPTTGRLFVGLYDTTGVAVIDGNSLQKLAIWPTGAAGHANGIGVTNGRVFVSVRDTGKLAILDSATGALIGHRPVGGLPYGVDAASGRVWIANFSSGTTSVIDAATTNPVAATTIGTNPSLIAAAPDRAFVTYWDGGVAVVAADGRLLQNWKLPRGSFGIAHDPAHNRVYVSNRVNRQIVMLNASTGAFVRSVTLAQTPFALAFNPNTNHLFAVLAESNQVDVRDGGTLDHIASLAVGAQGKDGGDGIAVFGNRVFVSNNAGNTVSVLSDLCGPTPTPTPTLAPTPTATATPDASDGIEIHEGTITLRSYNYAAFQTDALDPVFNIGYKKLDVESFLLTPGAVTLRTFRTIVMENDYLRLTFVPELGGRLYQVLFKPTGQTMFYNNKVIKPSPWGPAQQSGWLAAGGMEWALPVDEHGYEWGIPWEYTITRSAGSATITFTDTSANDRVRARVSITLPQDAAYFVLHPRIENPTPNMLNLQFWINAAVALNRSKVSPDTEFVLPGSEVYVHSTGDDFIPLNAVPPSSATRHSPAIPWPTIGGRDLSFYRNWDNYLGLFLASSQHGYMGAYDHASDLGVARVYPFNQVSGVKLFAFGPNFEQNSVYTDDGSDYFELWGGLPSTFFRDDNITLPAGESREWDEYWIPFAGTGGLSAATRDAILWLTSRNGLAYVGAAATTAGTRGTLVLYRDNQEIRRWDLTLVPGISFRDQVPVANGGHLKLRLTAPDGALLAETK